jgi:hypothetical protein
MYNIRIPFHHQDGRAWVIVNSIFLLIVENNGRQFFSD